MKFIILLLTMTFFATGYPTMNEGTLAGGWVYGNEEKGSILIISSTEDDLFHYVLYAFDGPRLGELHGFLKNTTGNTYTSELAYNCQVTFAHKKDQLTVTTTKGCEVYGDELVNYSGNFLKEEN